MTQRGVLAIPVELLGGYVAFSPDGAGQPVRFPRHHKVVEAAVSEGQIMLLIEGPEMPELKEGDLPERVRAVVSSGYPICQFKKMAT